MPLYRFLNVRRSLQTSLCRDSQHPRPREGVDAYPEKRWRRVTRGNKYPAWTILLSAGGSALCHVAGFCLRLLLSLDRCPHRLRARRVGKPFDIEHVAELVERHARHDVRAVPHQRARLADRDLPGHVAHLELDGGFRFAVLPRHKSIDSTEKSFPDVTGRMTMMKHELPPAK